MCVHCEYQGWTNRNSWAVALWLDNNEGDYHWACDVVNKSCRGAVYRAADELKESLEESNPLGDQANLWSDLMSYALSEVDWVEVARHYIDEDEIEPDQEEEEDAIDYDGLDMSIIAEFP